MISAARGLVATVEIAWRFRSYQPARITVAAMRKWLGQFPPGDRPLLLSLASRVIYLGESEVAKCLVDQNTALLHHLHAAGLRNNEIAYVQYDDPGSSSGVMLNLLRDRGGLERAGFKFADGRDTRWLHKWTLDTGRGALIYVDDFVGTGNQFLRNRTEIAQYVQGTFSEWLIAPVVCEEAIAGLARSGVEQRAGRVHHRAERPLHPNSTLFAPADKDRLIELCEMVSPTASLGYKDMATMVSLYRNTPNTIPMVLRGNVGQKPYFGLLPRYADLPSPWKK